MYAIELDAFEAMVRRAVSELPQPLLQRIENLDFTVEDAALPDDYRRTRTSPNRSTLLGVYRGVPLTSRTSGYQLTLPDRIVLFRAPLQGLARDEEHLYDLVRHTTHHEVAHYFGISDARLRELGAY
jgi:predicted Zn-dependent protease with MMP-like domain